ncbi:exostosin domain-containing protein [Aliiglaciecola lipolytica]|uniref:Exostosin GT47 domain-containing protein n=1 Tax=Aliiglaciecola lipolytica E3 TaxID=1127673 RepID=K6YPY4_9ALTE|nr:exostosin family protein [Aliiglaciecola lipolytica]GAC13365.1 hypothetical protein GLIP_0719 [Aliiglaciecola lipolytica E3]
MINVFFPYYQCGDAARQAEIELCLAENIKNSSINRLFVLIDDESTINVENDKVTALYLDKRPTYRKWIELTRELNLDGVSVLCNSDIYFDQTINIFKQLLIKDKRFVALSRWEVKGNNVELHPNPHWSQDVWAMSCDSDLSPDFMRLLDFPMGVPRCDNKITYLFGILGWDVFNPCKQVKSYHVHETEMRTYKKKLDDRILGGVAYPHPGSELDVPAQLEFDVYVKIKKNIKGIKINDSLEKWRKQHDQENNIVESKSSSLVSFEKAQIEQTVKALKFGKSILKRNANFEVFEIDDTLFFKNGYNLSQTIKLANAVNFEHIELGALLAYGVIPPVIDTYVDQISLKAKNKEDLNFWQYPCATEKQAYENHLSINHGEHIDFTSNEINVYVPLPWATYVDRKLFPQTYLARLKRLICEYRDIAKTASLTLKVHSVCQHIHWIRILETARDIGITDLHLSHKNSKSEETQRNLGFAFNLHGWTLIAVNYITPERSEGMERKPPEDKKLLASFIGAHMPHYIDDSRIKLFEAAKQSGRDDVFVDLGNEWHFNKLVYEEQVLSREIASHHIDEHHQKTFRYNSILSDSKFSLCPIGAGPNTLRLWESIAVGSIPVLFSKDLGIYERKFFNDIDILSHCIVWEGKIDDELFKYLAAFNSDKLKEMSTHLIHAYEYHEKLVSWSL